MTRSDPKSLVHHARRLISRVSPDNAGKVVSSDIYWTVPFLDLFLEKCDAVAFENPAEAYKLAFHAPSLAHWIGVGERPGEYVDEKEKRSYRARASAIFASTCFRIGEVGEARAGYGRAEALLEEGPTSRGAQADFLMRWGNFKTRTKPPGDAEALEHFNRALEMLTEIDSPAIAYGLVLRGTWHWSSKLSKEAAADYALALSLATKYKSSSIANRASIAALGNLAVLLTENQLLSMDHDRALALITQARKRLASQRLSAVKAKLFWVEGTLNRKLHLDRAAQRFLGKARDAFRDLRMPEEFILASLELGLMFQGGQESRLDTLRRSTIETLSSLSSDPALIDLGESWPVAPSASSLAAFHQAAASNLLAA